MKPRKESVLETPKKEHPHRITVSSAKRAGVEAEEQVADDVVQADRVPEVAAVVAASCGAGSVGGMLSKPLPYGWYSKRVCKKRQQARWVDLCSPLEEENINNVLSTEA